VRQLVDGIVEQLSAAAASAPQERRPAAGAVAVATDGVGELSESELDSLLVTLLDPGTQDAR
jgi:hypothetical protein